MSSVCLNCASVWSVSSVCLKCVLCLKCLSCVWSVCLVSEVCVLCLSEVCVLCLKCVLCICSVRLVNVSVSNVEVSCSRLASTRCSPHLRCQGPQQPSRPLQKVQRLCPLLNCKHLWRPIQIMVFPGGSITLYVNLKKIQGALCRIWPFSLRLYPYEYILKNHPITLT